MISAFAVMGTTATCGDCGVGPGFHPPTLYFEGQVRSIEGLGIRSTVESEQTGLGCNPSNVWITSSADSDSEGFFRVEHFAAGGLDGCFVIRAFASVEPHLVLDSVNFAASDLADIGDPFGTGVIPVDIIVH